MNPHPDFETLSAHLDGEAPEWDDHVAGCPECRAHLQRLAAVSQAVAQPPEAPGDVLRNDAIARALAATPVVGASSAPPAPTGAAAPVVDLSTERAARRGRPWMVAASVAAVLMAVVGAVALYDRGPGGGGDSSTALSGPGATANPEATTSGAGASTLTSTVEGGDLGELPDAAVLAERVGAALDQAAANSGRPTAPTAGVTAEPDSAPSAPAAGGSGPSSESGEGGTAFDDRAAATSPPLSRSVGTRACELQARDADAALGRLVYVASGSNNGEPVFVLGFALPADAVAAGGPPVRLMVLTQSGCELVSRVDVR